MPSFRFDGSQFDLTPAGHYAQEAQVKTDKVYDTVPSPDLVRTADDRLGVKNDPTTNWWDKYRADKRAELDASGVRDAVVTDPETGEKMLPANLVRKFIKIGEFIPGQETGSEHPERSAE